MKMMVVMMIFKQSLLTVPAAKQCFIHKYKQRPFSDAY